MTPLSAEEMTTALGFWSEALSFLSEVPLASCFLYFRDSFSSSD
jgi:hypothetical protein